MEKNGNIPFRGALKVFAEANGGNPAEMVEGIRSGLKNWQGEYDNKVKSLNEQLVNSEKKQEELNQTISDLQASYDDLAKRIAAGQMNGVGSLDPDAALKSAAMAQYLRTGEVNAAALTKEGELGVVAPSEWDRTLTDKLVEISPARQLFNVIPTEKASFKKVYNKHGFASGWVGETDSRPETATGQLAEYEFKTGEIYANPLVSQTALDDAEINVEDLISSELSDEFSLRENQAFFQGDGTKNKPLGILTFVTGQANANVHPLGEIKGVQAVNSSASQFYPTDFIELVGALPTKYAAGAAFMMNRKTMTLARKMKNDMGDFIWQQSMQAGQPSRLLGYPVYEVVDMPDTGSGSIPVLFGNFKSAYIILDRKGVRVLRDPYSNKPYISFYTTKRVGGSVSNPEAVIAMLM